MTDNEQLAHNIVTDIILELKWRRGFRQTFDEIDEDIQADLEDTLKHLVLKNLEGAVR